MPGEMLLNIRKNAIILNNHGVKPSAIQGEQIII